MHLIILKMIATSGFLTAVECTKFFFGRATAPDPAWGAYNAPTDSPCIKPYFEGTGENGKKKGRKREGEGLEGDGGLELAMSRPLN